MTVPENGRTEPSTLSALDLPVAVIAGIATAASASFPFDIGAQLKDNPLVTKLPNGGFAFDKPLDLKSTLTKDWLELNKCVGLVARRRH